jgi:hypothetical protein
MNWNARDYLANPPVAGGSNVEEIHDRKNQPVLVFGRG